MRVTTSFPNAAQLDAQRANHLQAIHPSIGTLEADIIATPMPSRRHKIARNTARVVGAVGLTSAVLGIIDAYNGATHDIPEAKTAVVQEIEAIDMRDTDTAITTGLFTEEGAQQMSQTAEDVQYAVNQHRDEVEAAFSKTAGGTVQAALGSSMLVAGVGAGSILKRRAAKQQSTAIELKDTGKIDNQIFPDALYQDRLGLRHISKNGPNDTSPILELRPSKRFRDRADQMNLKTLGAASTVLAGFFIASSPAFSAIGNTIDASVTTLQNTAPVANASNYLAQKAADAAKPTLEQEIKETTADIIAKKLPKTEHLAQTMPLMAAVKEKVVNETTAQVLDSNAVAEAVATNESHALGSFAESLNAESPLRELTGTMGIGGLVLTRTIRRKMHLRSDAHTKVRVSEDFLRANMNTTAI